MDEVCKELDQILVEIVRHVEKLEQQRELHSQQMKEGFWNMTKARHAGVKISTYQFPTNMHASLTVQSDEDSEVPSFFVQTEDEKKVEESKDSKVVESEDKEPTKKRHSKSNNPLHWYGVLVPPSLRQAQKNFTQATIHIVDILNTVHSLNSLQSKYKELLVKKQELLATQQQPAP